MPLNCLIEVLLEIELEDKGLLAAKNRQQDILDADLELHSIDVAEILLKALKAKVFMLVTCATVDVHCSRGRCRCRAAQGCRSHHV